MSGIAVIYNLDGRPVDRDLLSRMINAVPYRGPDGIRVWTDGPVGLAHAMTCTTPESLHETQPLVDNDAGLVLTLDGRVDNREELSALLTSKGYRLRDDTDAELVLRAYECWGEDSPAKIIGDFAYAVWDSRRRRLFCARDVVGVKPLYYYRGDNTFLCASEILQIVGCPNVSRAPNEPFLAQVFENFVEDAETTAFVHVQRLKQSHCMTVDSKSLRTSQYFDLETVSPIRYRTDAEYAEHFRELTLLAVRASLRSNRAVGAELSGGVDSSSIVGAVQHLREIGAVANSRFAVFSMVFNERDAYEREYIDQVLQRWELEAFACAPYTPTREECLNESRRTAAFPEYPNGASATGLRRLERREGFGVVLTGFGGDEWLNGNPFNIADLIWNGRFTDLIHDLRDHSRARALDPRAVTKPTGRYFLTFGLIPALSRLLPGPLRSNLKKYLRAVKADPLFVPEFSRRTNQHRRAAVTFASAPGDSFVQRSICRPLVEGWSSYGLEMDERAMAPYGIEQRHPFYNRRIIEFCYWIPEEQRQRGTIKKYVLRKALGDLLPSAVRDRQSKAEFSGTFVKALETVGGERAFHTLSPMVRRWINQEQAVAMYRKMTERFKNQDANYKIFVSRLWSVVAVDIWCKAVFG